VNTTGHSRESRNDPKKVTRAREGHFLLKAGSKMVKERLKCILLSWAGYILSPLSFWNDAFVNIPIAYAIGLLFGILSRKFFLPGMIFGYWLSNILGFVLLHKGIVCIGKPGGQLLKFTKGQLITDGIISLAYTIGIVILVKIGLVKFLADYFH
jgi:hypothetical protein